MLLKTRPGSLTLLLISYFIFFAMAIPNGLLNVAWTYMQGTYSVSLDSLGVILFAATCGSLIGTFSSGRVIGRFGVGGFMMSGSLIALLGLLGYIVAPSWPVLVGAAFVMALGFSIFNAALNLFVSANYTTGQLNWLHACFGVGLTVGPALTTVLVEQLKQSWHVGYLIVFVVIAGVTVLLWITRNGWFLADAPKPGAAIETVSYRESLLVPAVMLGVASFFAFGGVVYGTGQLSATLLSARGIGQAGFWVSFYWASFTIGRIIMGFIAHRIDNGLLIRACMIGGVIGALLLWQSAASFLNLIGLALIGLACAPLYPTLIAATRARVGLRHRANAIGFQIAASSLGQSVLPGAMAWIAERTQVGVIGALPLVGLLVVLTLQEFAARRKEEVVTAMGV